LRGLGGGREGTEWVVREGVGAGREMTQALYAHMNNKTIKKKIVWFYILFKLLNTQSLMFLNNVINNSFGISFHIYR
jgi:hypothetical protein